MAALAAFAVVAGVTTALVIGLRPQWQAAIRSVLVAVDMTTPAPSPSPRPPPPPPPQRRAADSAPTGSPAPRNLRGKATPIFAPPILPPLVVPPPIQAAPIPAIGAATQSGAADLAGPGAGAGGKGDGGGGTGGNGRGSGAGQGPRQIRGKLSYSDLPQGLVAPGTEAGVGVRYTVETDGGVSNCRIDQSSGFAALDAAVCRLIEARFRFRPAHDAAGRPVASTVAEDHVWVSAPEGG